MAGVNYWTPKPELVGDALLKLIASVRKKYGSYDDYQMAAAVGLPLEIYKGRLSWAQSQHTKDLPIYSLGTPIAIEGDCMNIGDAHNPFASEEWIHLVALIAQKHLKPPRILNVMGDWMNFDIFSSFAKLIPGPGWAEEKRAASKNMQEYAETFDTINFFMGNHERRLSRATEGELNENDLADLLSINITKLRVSRFGYCTVHSGGKTWRVSHPKEYSAANQLGKADLLAQKFQTHVITFHQHYLSLGQDKWNRYTICNGGCLVNQNSLAYKTLDDDTRPEFVNGFTMLRNGTPYLFGKEPITDWSNWL